MCSWPPQQGCASPEEWGRLPPPPAHPLPSLEDSHPDTEPPIEPIQGQRSFRRDSSCGRMKGVSGSPQERLARLTSFWDIFAQAVRTQGASVFSPAAEGPDSRGCLTASCSDILPVWDQGRAPRGPSPAPAVPLPCSSLCAVSFDGSHGFHPPVSRGQPALPSPCRAASPGSLCGALELDLEAASRPPGYNSELKLAKSKFPPSPPPPPSSFLSLRFLLRLRAGLRVSRE